MKRWKLVPIIAMVFCLSFVVTAQLPQKNQSQPSQPQVDQDRIEAAHGKLLSGEDKAKEASRLTEAVAPALPGAASSTAPVPRKNFVDEHIFGRIERDKIPHAPVAGDEEFLRRAYLDATGLLPTPDQVRSFLRDTDPNKRDKLIDSLIGSEEFTDQWAYHFGELLRTREAQFHIWTKQWLKVDRPYNEVFADMVTPVTKNAKGFPTALTFYDPIGYISTRCGLWTDADDYKGLNRLDWVDEITSDIGRVFLGLSMDCFSCHNGAGHADSFNMFLGSMKRTEFWQQAAFFGKMRNIGHSDGSARNFYGGSSLFDDLAPGYNTGNDGLFYTPAEGRFPRDGKTYEPAFLLTGEKPKPGEDPRKALARIAPTHIQFARAAVNIVWQKLMVVGLVEPYDGFDLKRLDPKNPPPAPWTIQPANPELLEALAKDFRDNNFSIHRVIKTIMKSNAYQLSTSFEGEWKDAYIPYYARRFARVLTGPEAVDIVTQATAAPFDLKLYGQDRQYVKELTSPLSLKGDGGGGGALNAGNSPEKQLIFAFMQSYYQAERAMPPVDKNVASPVQAMMMMTSPVVTKRVSAEGKTRVANLLKAGKSDDEIIEELFLASLTRRPTADEVEVAKRVIAKDRKTGPENLQWALLNSTEFLVNH
ncbi:MAG: hypothetical protein DMG13_15850 [Acidobacteria bacterium]|nr:MAG: hypothetical protein DMG13_15850 [Acidobacteriota bacterium]